MQLQESRGKKLHSEAKDLGANSGSVLRAVCSLMSLSWRLKFLFSKPGIIDYLLSYHGNENKLMNSVY